MSTNDKMKNKNKKYCTVDCCNSFTFQSKNLRNRGEIDTPNTHI